MGIHISATERNERTQKASKMRYIVTLELIIDAENKHEAKHKFWQDVLEDNGYLSLKVEEIL